MSEIRLFSARFRAFTEVDDKRSDPSRVNFTGRIADTRSKATDLATPPAALADEPLDLRSG
jgi:hypothetical protein